MLKGVLQHYKRDRRSLVLLAALGLVTAAVEAASVMVLAPLLQAVAEGSDTTSSGVGPFQFSLGIVELSALAAGLVLINLVLGLVAAWATARVISWRQLRGRTEMVQLFLNADWETQSRLREGRLVAYALDFVNQSALGLRDVAWMIRYSVSLGVFVAGAFVISWSATTLICLVAVVVFLLQRPLRRMARSYSSAYSSCNVVVSEELATLGIAARDISIYDVDAAASSSVVRTARTQRRLRIRGDVLAAVPSPVFRSAGLLVIIGLIASAASSGDLEVAELGVVVLLLYRSLSYGQNLASTYTKLVSLSPVLEQLDAEQEVFSSSPRSDGSLTKTAASRVVMSSATYRYPNADEDVLVDVSLQIARGEVVGVVGPSGAGKSTIADLLVGLRYPQFGSVELDGVPISEIRRDSRAGLISLVPQAVPVVPGTIRQNVDFYRGLDTSILDGALHQVGLASLVESLADGADTLIGSGNRAVSGGQAQRLGIARALAGSPSFIVFDEPTSALDPGSEEIVTDMIGRLRGSVGVVVIAHRLSTLRYCDRVLVVEEGRLSADGTLSALRQRNDFVKQAFELGELDWAAGSGSM